MMCLKQVVEQGRCTQDPTKHLVGRKIHYLAHCLLLRRKATGLQAGLSKQNTHKKPKQTNKTTKKQKTKTKQEANPPPSNKTKTNKQKPQTMVYQQHQLLA